MATEITVMAPRASIVPMRTSRREYFIDNKAEMKKVLSPISLARTRAKAAVSPGTKPVESPERNSAVANAPTGRTRAKRPRASAARMGGLAMGLRSLGEGVEAVSRGGLGDGVCERLHDGNGKRSGFL